MTYFFAGPYHGGGEAQRIRVKKFLNYENHLKCKTPQLGVHVEASGSPLCSYHVLGIRVAQQISQLLLQ